MNEDDGELTNDIRIEDDFEEESGTAGDELVGFSCVRKAKGKSGEGVTFVSSEVEVVEASISEISIDSPIEVRCCGFSLAFAIFLLLSSNAGEDDAWSIDAALRFCLKLKFSTSLDSCITSSLSFFLPFEIFI